MKRDFTSGSVLRNIAYFSLPYLLSYFLQTLYGMADLFIIGQFEGAASTTAVSVGSQIMHMITVVIVGLAMGTTVCIGQAIGAKDRARASSVVGNTVTLFIAASLVLAGILLLFVKAIVSLMSTPAEAVDGTIQYLMICFVGIPFITAYNVISSIFRGLGDSKTPMYFIAVACLCNIGLDYLFMGGLGMGPAGAALGTTLSQTISVILALVTILRKKNLGISIKGSDLKPAPSVMSQIVRIGIPIALQDGFIQIAFLIITVIANRRGLNAAAAVGIVEKIISFVFLVPSSMLSTVSALGAQNVGAGQHERASSTLGYAICITVIYGLVISVAVQFIGENIVGLFTSDTAVTLLGEQYIHGYIFDCIFAGIHFSFSGYFCAYGRSEISFLHNIIAICCMRIPGVYLTSLWFPDTLFPMGIATACGSLLSVIVCLIAYKWLKTKGIIPSGNRH